MNEQLASALEAARGAWRFRWVGMIAAWLVAIAAVIVLLIMPDTYESRARVYVDTQSVLQPLLKDIAVQRDSEGQVRMMSTLLRSRSTLERVAKQSGMAAQARTERDRENTLADLAAAIKLDSAGRNDNFAISYRNSSPVMAQRVVQTLLDVFMQDTVGIRRSDSGAAAQFLRGQIADLERRLSTAERRLADFKKKNVGLMPGQAGDYFTRLQTLMDSVEALRSRYRQMESRHSELQRQLSSENPNLVSNADAAAVAEQIGQAQTKLEALLTQYTEKHPQVVALREQIARLQEQQVSGSKSGGAANVLSTTTSDGRTVSVLNVNPVYQNMRLALTQTEAEMAEVRGQIGEQARQVAELRARANVVPDIEAQLAQLNRDYEVNKAQHAALLQRLESARISGEAGEETDQSRFQIIDPPNVPLVPVSVGHSLLLAAAALGSVAAGVLAALLMYYLRPAFYNTDALRASIKGRVLGSVSFVDFDRARSWYRRAVPQFLCAAGGLLVFFAVSAIAMKFLRPVIVAAGAGGVG